MKFHQEETAIVVIGAGVAGLTLATFLQSAGLSCVVLERCSRAYVAQRQRAGVVEARAVQMFEQWGLADTLLAGPVAHTIDYRINGSSRIFESITDTDRQSRFCTQQMLVNNLLHTLIDTKGGDVRFDVDDIHLTNDDGCRPSVRYHDARGTSTITCDYIVGCDAARGVTRSSIPDGVLTRYSHTFDYAWLAALVEAPVTGHPIMGVSDHGFVAQLPRGPNRSRCYVQCDANDTAADWPDARMWEEIRRRIGDAAIENAVVHDKEIVSLRSVVYAPMQYRNLFLAGDAAHLLPPTGAKGMNLALYDVDVLAQALRSALHDADNTALNNYSDTVLPQVWQYQAFSVWMTDTLHDAGDPKINGRFRQMIARSRLDALFASPAAARLHSEQQRGIP